MKQKNWFGETNKFLVCVYVAWNVLNNAKKNKIDEIQTFQTIYE